MYLYLILCYTFICLFVCCIPPSLACWLRIGKGSSLSCVLLWSSSHNGILYRTTERCVASRMPTWRQARWKKTLLYFPLKLTEEEKWNGSICSYSHSRKDKKQITQLPYLLSWGQESYCSENICSSQNFPKPPWSKPGDILSHCLGNSVLSMSILFSLLGDGIPSMGHLL